MISVRYFAHLREAAGREGESLELEGGAPTLGDLLIRLGKGTAALEAFFEKRPVLCAVNEEYAGRDRVLREGDEVALFPPVSGG